MYMMPWLPLLTSPTAVHACYHQVYDGYLRRSEIFVLHIKQANSPKMIALGVGLNPRPSQHSLQSSRFIHYAMSLYKNENVVDK